MELMRINGKSVVFGGFRLSNNLLYILKSISRDSENDIVTYFYNMGLTLFIDVTNRKKLPLRCSRVVKVFYKNTGVCVKFEVWSSYFKSDFSKTIEVSMSLSHIVGDWRHINRNNMDTMLSETSLGLSDEPVLRAKTPQMKLYKCLEERKPRSSVSEDKKINWSALPQQLKAKFGT